MKFKNLDFENVLIAAKAFKLSQDDSYIIAYPEFIKYFNEIGSDELRFHHLVISSHFIYGWMPTIIHLNISQKDEVLSLLNKVKLGQLLNSSQLHILKECINGSMVGLSKLLHFINPEIYPIWDSKIYKYITDKNSTYGIDRPENYISYLNEVLKIANHIDFNKISKLICNKLNYQVSQIRVIELCIFQYYKNQKHLK
ncbi:MAG: hypothetical protein KDC49_10485 [Saprospiraceae bacterium]|nr:hypothetical protein [Saprospiraceae bacterium]